MISLTALESRLAILEQTVLELQTLLNELLDSLEEESEEED